MAKATGVAVYEKTGERRDSVKVLEEISKKYRHFKSDKERVEAVASAWGKTDLDTQKGIKTLLAEGAIDDIIKMQNDMGSAAGTIDRDLQSAINNSVDQAARLRAALGQAADEFARPVNDAITRGIKYLLDEKGIGGKEMLAGGAAASLAGFGALKLGGRALMGMGASAAGGVIGSLTKNMGLGGIKLPMPVYVVNRHMSLTREAMTSGGAPVPVGGKPVGGKPAPAGAKPAPGGTTTSAGGKALARLGNGARLAGPVVAVGVAALDAAQTLLDETATTAQKVEAVAETGGAAMGGWAGAAAGAAIGSVVPVVGTAIGGIIGGILGSLGGGWLAQKATQKLNEGGTSEDLARAFDEMNSTLENAQSESVVRVEVNGGTATLQSHNGPGRVDVYSGMGYASAYGSPD
jgi:phage tail tape-measure protein